MEFYTIEEKGRTAKALLVLLYHNNYKHLKSYLNSDKMDTIRNWSEDAFDIL